MNERANNLPGAAVDPGPGYGGRTRYTQLEYEAVLANASIGIAFTRDRKFFLCNPKFAEMFGWGQGELIGQSGEVIYPSVENYQALGQIAVPVLSGGRQLDLEWEMRRKDGSTFLARMIAKAIDPENPRQGTVWIVEDITERKRAADEVNRLLREQDAIFETASIGIAFVRERHILRCNRRFEEIFGYAVGEMANTPTRVLHADEEVFLKLGHAYEQLARGLAHSENIPARRKDGGCFWVRLTGRAADPGDPMQGSVWTAEDITEQKRSDEEMQRMVLEQQALLNNVVIGICFVRQGKVLRCNRRLEELFGYSPGELLGGSTRVIYFTDEEYAAAARNYRDVDDGRTNTHEQFLRRKDGSGFWCRLSGRAVESGRVEGGSVWLFEDISERRDSRKRIKRALAEQELILSNATVGIGFVRERVLRRANPRLAEMTGRRVEDLVGQSTAILFASEEEWNEASQRAYESTEPGKTHEAEVRFKRADGSSFLCRTVGRRIDSGAAEQEWIWSFEDVTAQHAMREGLVRSRDELERLVSERTAELQAANRKLESEIGERVQAENLARHLADHDMLTGLPNRRILEDRLTQALAFSQRNRKQTAVMFVDLDRFKHINDSLGHAVGDSLLKEVAGRLSRQLRDGDTICRIGGDEFVVVLPEVKRAADPANVAQKIIENLSMPFMIEGHELTITPSLGISVYPDDGRDAEALIRNADAAMYHAKEMGRANYQFFTAQMNLTASRRIALEGDLRRAQQKDELRVFYQPIAEIGTRSPVAREALLRWAHPAKGLVAPGEFLGIAEDIGLIHRIGERVLQSACAWTMGLEQARRIPVSVNLSMRQFSDPRLIELVGRVLKDTGLPAGLLGFEIKESTLMHQTDHTLATLRKLKDMGVTLSADDFGRGQSSLAFLKRFPLDRVKIDRSFIADLPGNADDCAVVAAIVGLAHHMKLQVVAGGVEREEQLALLADYGCDLVQGYLIGEPVEAESAA